MGARLNLRNGNAWVGVNGTRHQIQVIDVTGFVCNGTICTITTLFPHGLTNGGPVYLHNIDEFPGYGYVAALTALNGINTATVTGATTFTVPCTAAAHNYLDRRVHRPASRSVTRFGTPMRTSAIVAGLKVTTVRLIR